MGRNPESCFGDARRREHEMLALLARVALGRYELGGCESETDLRQLGYVAELALGRVEDPDRNLSKLVAECRERLKGFEAPDGDYRDSVQARWGAEWNFDIGKLKTELPLYRMQLARN